MFRKMDGHTINILKPISIPITIIIKQEHLKMTKFWTYFMCTYQVLTVGEGRYKHEMGELMGLNLRNKYILRVYKMLHAPYLDLLKGPRRIDNPVTMNKANTYILVSKWWKGTKTPWRNGRFQSSDKVQEELGESCGRKVKNDQDMAKPQELVWRGSQGPAQR